MPPMGFETTILVSVRPQTHALDCTATGIGSFKADKTNIVKFYVPQLEDNNATLLRWYDNATKPISHFHYCHHLE
jgi:hypothetical protein